MGVLFKQKKYEESALSDIDLMISTQMIRV